MNASFEGEEAIHEPLDTEQRCRGRPLYVGFFGSSREFVPDQL